jgi:hypothetical protein
MASASARVIHSSLFVALVTLRPVGARERQDATRRHIERDNTTADGPITQQPKVA